MGTRFVLSVLETGAGEWLPTSVNKNFPTYKPTKPNEETNLISVCYLQDGLITATPVLSHRLRLSYLGLC
jgi:hypothetical protein